MDGSKGVRSDMDMMAAVSQNQSCMELVTTDDVVWWRCLGSANGKCGILCFTSKERRERERSEPEVRSMDSRYSESVWSTRKDDQMLR